jgi:hypothetical protein
MEIPRLHLGGVEDLRRAAVQRISEEFASMPAVRAPIRSARRRPAELARFTVHEASSGMW